MKTTIEISDPLFAEVKRLAAREETTVRALVEEGLRTTIERRKSAPKKRIRLITVSGGGLSPEFADASWEKILEAAYEGRGG
jgi:hypothetical protein